MNIVLHTMGMPFNGTTIPDGKSLGGSESAGYYIARELVKLGHRVVQFTNSQDRGVWDGVAYEWVGPVNDKAPLGEHFHYAMQAPYDILIIQRHPTAFNHEFNTKMNVWWLHDYALHRTKSLVLAQMYNIDMIFTVSEWHRQQIASVYGIEGDNVVATTNGIDYADYEGKSKPRAERREKALIYGSRPERGLENLIKPGGIMEQLPDYHLYVCGYENTTEKMKAYYQMLWRMCDERENVSNMGALGKGEFAELMGECMAYVYPSTFEDTSCMVSLEANACGLPFVGFKTAALPETMRNGGAELLSLRKDGQIREKKFIAAVKRVVEDEHEWRRLHEKALAKRQTWEGVAQQWSGLFETTLSERCAEKKRLHAHLERYSDIMAAISDGADEGTIPGLEKNYYFLFQNDFQGHYDRYYQYEEDRGVIYGPENLAANNRFRATLNVMQEIKAKRVLDYACAHGHYTMNLARHLPEVEFVGIDMSEKNIRQAIEWAEQDKVDDRTEFRIGTESALTEADSFDVILLGEILEHVPDPINLVEILTPYLEPGGTFVISVPYGPWEWLGYHKHPGWRAHLHHFEREDLLEMFGNQDGYKLMALPYRPMGSGRLGNLLVKFRPNGKPYGHIDYERKLRQQGPAETVSVCMIARDEEHTIGRTLKTVTRIANEIIIGIDEKTKDKTQEIAEQFGAKCFKIPSPLEIGFDDARNKTIERARMDWIFWIDCDETLENVDNFFKYLKPNAWDGYAIAQHHYAVEPAALFKTDLPCRLFRNHRGIKFYGHVHEHPEKEINSGAGHVWLLPDVAIMHTGYATELARRGRFQRNYPLMNEDRKKWPNRNLGKFLWMRDTSHMVRYSLEGTGGKITPEIINMATVVVNTWRELIKLDQARMVVDGLPFYTEAVKVLTRGRGVQFAINLRADIAGNGSNPADWYNKTGGFRKDPYVGTFMNTQDIKAVSELLLKHNLAIFEEKYF